ncbi:MAG: hypothetical protein H8D38_00285 [DPANN group archaeon]|nr:hypothetical protein [DPANN group archaeon]
MANLKLMQPQEIEVLYILPTIRRELTFEMKRFGLEQKKIAELLCVTEAAISQYLNSKRATKVKFSKDVLKIIKNSAKKIINKETMISETQDILKMLKEKGLTCDVHKELADLPDDCLYCHID